MLNINELIENFHQSVSDFKSKVGEDMYHTGRVHAFILVFSELYKQRLINGDTLSQLKREWDEAFQSKYGIADKENENN